MKSSLYRIVLLATLLLPGSAAADADKKKAYGEYLVKAVFLHRLMLLVEWPAKVEKAGLPLNLCFFGKDPFTDTLKKIAEKKVRGHRLVFKRKLGLQQLVQAQCQLLFISKQEQKHLKNILAVLKGLPVLSVGEAENFAKSGGIASLIRRKGHINKDRISIELNVQAAKRAELIVDSRLLHFATPVKEARNEAKKD
ncbi:MAG: YfiR family protein [Gammaproteobacteria bacterium]|nr:YfiR family protein [Gammaproteobacteria bacterium]